MKFRVCQSCGFTCEKIEVYRIGVGIFYELGILGVLENDVSKCIVNSSGKS